MDNSEWKKFMVVVVGLLEILIFSGTILGWTSLKLMLKNEGIYEYLCHNIPTSKTNETNLINYQNPEELLIASESTLENHTKQINATGVPLQPLFKNDTNFTLKINFTLFNSAHSNDSSQDSLNTIVIPFETQGTYNHSFIYQLLNDSSLMLKSNDIQVKLITDPRTPSTLEQYLDLYLKENLQPLFPANDIDRGCKQQEIVLNLAFSIGSFCMGAAAFIWGFLLEKLGLRFVRLIINGMFTLGAFLLCFISKGRDWLLFPALLIMSLSGVPIRIANMQISNLYPGKRSTIISIYSGAFSASSIIYVILQYIYSTTEIDFFWVNFILVILSILTIPFTLVLPKDKVKEPNSATKKPLHKSNLPVYDKNHIYSTNIDELFNKKFSVETKSSIQLQNYKQIASPNLNRKNEFINKAYEPDSTLELTNPKVRTSETIGNNSLTPGNHKSPPLRISLTTFAYNLHQLWFSWMITYMVMYVGSLDLWTKRVTDDKISQSLFLKMYGFVQVLALVVSPIAGLLMDWQLNKANREKDPMEKRVKQAQSGFWPLFITSLTLIICVLCHYFNREEFIYVSIVFITIYRSFLLAVGSAFLRIRFHPDHFNQLLGIMSSVSAVISLLQIPIYSWEKNSESNVIYVNILNTIIAFLVMSNPVYLLFTPLQRNIILKEEEQLKKSLN